MNISVTRVLAICSLMFALTGCASMQPISNYARTGDTVMVALGGEHNRATVPVVKKENISITITDASGAVYPVKVRNLFKLYADFGSRMNVAGVTQGSFEFGQGAYQGDWMAVIDLVDPVSGAKPPLAAGAATLAVQSGGQITDATGSNGDIRSIPIQILAGQGSLNKLNEYSTFGGGSVRPVESLEPLQQIEVSPDAAVALAGGSFELTLATTEFADSVRVIPSTQDPFVQLMTSKESMPDGSVKLMVMVLNPEGFMSTNSHQGLSQNISDFRSINFRLAWANPTLGIDDTNWQNFVSLDSSRFVNMNGDTVSSVGSVMNKIR